MLRSSKVRRRGSPLGPPLAIDATYRSMPPVVRFPMNASLRPSGENTGPQSPNDPSGGDVILCFSPDARDSKKTLSVDCGEILSTIASDLPSGDHDNDSPQDRAAVV